MPFYFEPDKYNELLAEKIGSLQSLLADFSLPDIEIYNSPKQHFRMRAEFRMWHDNDSEHPSPYPAMFNKENPRVPIRITRFPIACKPINDIVEQLPNALQQDEILKHRLFQMECLSSQKGDTVLTLIYHKKLDDDWEKAATNLAKQLNVHIVGRSRKQKVIIGNDFIHEEFLISHEDKECNFKYKQLENTFTQPNASMNTAMLNWVFKNTQGIKGDALELYCGNGNFTVALAKNFKRVFATEVVKSAVKTARENLQLNHLKNCEVVRMSSEEFTQAMQGDREFRRLKEIDLNNYAFSTILVDPPRSGLDHATCNMIQSYENILYISCNPETLCDNLKTLCQTHDIKAAAAFDQFPYTHHLESAVLLTLKQTHSSTL